MPDESAFIAAVADNPDDDSFRLVYADWLEERADPRAEYLRLVAALTDQSSPTSGDDPRSRRLSSLARQTDKTWREAVGRRFDLVLVAIRPDRKIHTIKLIRQQSGLGLKEAVDVVNNLPSVVLNGLLREDAELRGYQIETGDYRNPGYRRPFDGNTICTIRIDPSRRAAGGRPPT